MKNRQYWLDRGSQRREYKGFVCVGEGDENDHLHRQLNIEQEELYCEDLGQLSSNWEGSAMASYYVKQETFDRLFPEPVNQMKFYIEVKSSEHSEQIQKTAFSRGYTWTTGDQDLLTLSKGNFILFENGRLLWDMTVPSSEEGYRKGSIDDLFGTDEVGFLGEHEVIVDGGKVKVGCIQWRRK